MTHSIITDVALDIETSEIYTNLETCVLLNNR